MSFSNPRRTPVTRPAPSTGDGLKLKTSNLSLKKGATFHSPVTPPSSPSPGSAFKVPLLPRRSQTNLDDVVGANRRRAALTIGNFEDRLAATEPEPSSSRRSFRDDILPIPRGVLNHIVSEDTMCQGSSSVGTERRVLRPRHRRSSNHHESDSGLGTSVATTAQKKKENASSSGSASAITGSASTCKTESIQRLSPRAVSRITEHTLRPLLEKASLKAFRPIVLDCPRRIQENQIVCLRDLEKTLIFMAPERAKSSKLYLDFCITSIRCIQATVEYLSDREQTRAHDRPYTNGYFIDLVDQIRQHAQQMQEARQRTASGEQADEMEFDPTDEVKLMGGLTTTGRPAELVRVKKNGKAVSLATGQPVEDLDEDSQGPVRFKRSMSEQLEDEEEILRSMARRKKNASPEELAPKKCTHPGCKKEFKRPCDLTKHEKTHSRPWKCPEPTCKFHDYGWPTEKEMSRHVNDKHSNAPAMYECEFKPCPYKSKRESNCKQHMEKAHGWTYHRTKAPKRPGSKAGSSCKPTPLINNLPTPSSDQTDNIMTPPGDSPFAPYADDLFPTFPTEQDFNPVYAQQIEDIQLDFSPIDNGTPSTDDGQFNYQDLSPEFTGQFDDIYGAHVQVPTPTHSHSIYNKVVPDVYNFTTTETCPPVPAPHFSPAGQGNQMLYTPTSMIDVDEGFDEFSTGCSDQFGGDFLLFPSSTITKPEFDTAQFGNISDIVPSLAGGFTQPSSQDFNIDYNQAMDWTATDFQSFGNPQ